jgi:cell division protein YceG involved in septum cleavage
MLLKLEHAPVIPDESATRRWLRKQPTAVNIYALSGLKLSPIYLVGCIALDAAK